MKFINIQKIRINLDNVSRYYESKEYPTLNGGVSGIRYILNIVFRDGADEQFRFAVKDERDRLTKELDDLCYEMA